MKQFQENTDKFPVPLNSVHLDLSRGLKALASILKSKIIKPRNITENDPATLSYLYFYPDTIISGDCDVILNQVTGNKCGDNNEPVDLKSSKNNIPFSLNFVGYFNDYKPYYNTFSYL
jgi:hypothetical protein